MPSTFTLAELTNFEKAAAKPAAAPAPAATSPDASTADPAAATTQQDPADASPASADTSDPAAPDGDSTADNNPADPANADDATTVSDTDTDPETTADGDTPPPQPPKGKQTARDRIQDLVDERDANLAYARHLEARLAQLAQQPTAPAAAATLPAQPDTSDPRPTLESAGYDVAKFDKAEAEWLDRQIEKRVSTALTTRQAKQEAETVGAAFQARTAEFKKTAADFDVVVLNPNLPSLASIAIEAVKRSEVGPQIVYHLAKNPATAVRIARSTPDQQLLALGRITEQLTRSAPAPAAVQKNRTTTKAPPPPTNVRGSATPAKDPAHMSMTEFAADFKAKRVAARSGRK